MKKLLAGFISVALIFAAAETPMFAANKAYAAGITTGTSADKFEPNATLTRRQMATFIYRTLRYVEKNSDYKYTDYTSKLSDYTDAGQASDMYNGALIPVRN